MLRNFVRAGLALAVMLAFFTPRGTAFAINLHAPQALSLKLGNQVFNDLNNNGLREDGEMGVPDVLVRLLDGDTGVVGYTRTDAQGLYLFSALVPGEYSVEIVLPPTYQSSQDVATSATPDNGVDDDDNGVLLLGSVVRSYPVLVGGVDLPEANLTLDFGIWQPAGIGDWVWQDNNNDGLQTENEPGLPDVEITLYDADGSPLNTTHTDADGHYFFDGLTPGQYAVGVTLIEGYEFAPQVQGSGADDSGAVDSDINPLTGRTALLPLQPGEKNLQVDAGLFPTALQLSIALTSQPSPSGLDDPSSVRPGDVITYAITITNIGNNSVTNIVVMNVVPNGAAYIADSASPTLDASSRADTLVWIAPVLNATQSMTMSFAVQVATGMGSALTKLRNEAVVRSDQTPPVISNRISHDVVPQTAPGPAISIIVLPDVQTITVGSTAVFTVQVTNTGGFDLYGTEVHPSTVADCDHFIGALPVGESVSYICKQANVMSAFTDTLTTLSFAGRGSLVLSSYTLIVNLKPTARLGDYVWLDEDGDGTQRSNAGMAGVRVQLLPLAQVTANTNISESAISQTTNPQGFYMFDDVSPGRYRVCVVSPTGYSFTRQGSNPASGVDSDVDPATGCTRPITATASVIDASIDVGLVPVVMQLAQTAQPQPTSEDNRLHINIGDRITYTLGLHNAGLQPARNVVVTDALPLDVQIISGTMQPTATWAAGQLGWSLAELGSGERYTISFAVRVVSKLNGSIQNRAFVETTQTPMTVSNDVIHVFSPTAVQLLSFVGRWVMGAPQGIELAWQTGAELNTFGFALHRSETGERSNRVRVTPQWIAAQNSTGATYAFVDETALPGQRYTYWLIETERDGDVIEYDPITVKAMSSGAMADVPAGGVPMAGVAVQPLVAPRIVLNTAANAAPAQAVAQVQAQPVSTQQANTSSAQSALSAVEPRSEPQLLVSTPEPRNALINIAPAPISQPTREAVISPINTASPRAVHAPTRVPPRGVEAVVKTPSQARSSVWSGHVLLLVGALVGLMMILSLAGGLLILRISIRTNRSSVHHTLR